MTLIIFVAGQPRSQGSKRWMPNGAMREAGAENLKPWRAAITSEAVGEIGRTGWETLGGPVYVSIDFLFMRPKSHYGTGRNQGVTKANAPLFHSSQPDIDKLARAVLDSLTDAAVFRDDSQVATLTLTKTYAERQGARIEVGAIT